MIQLLLILLILVCLSYILLQKEHFYNASVGNLKVVGGNKGIKLTWIKPPASVYKYYIILKSMFRGDVKTAVYVHKTTNDLIEYYIKDLPNNIIYEVTVIPHHANNQSYITNPSNTTEVRTDQYSPLCLSNTRCEPGLAREEGGVTAQATVIDMDEKESNKLYNEIQQMIIANRKIDVTNRTKDERLDYTINIK
jgi:hypothetical protein